MRMIKKFWKWLIEMPGRFKTNWQLYKVFCKLEYKKNKMLMDTLLGIERKEEKDNAKKN